MLFPQEMECGMWLIWSKSWKYVRPYKTGVEKGWLKCGHHSFAGVDPFYTTAEVKTGDDQGINSQVQDELMKGNGEEVGGLFSNVIIEKLRLEGWPSVTIDIQQRLADHSCSDPFNGRQHCEGWCWDNKNSILCSKLIKYRREHNYTAG